MSKIDQKYIDALDNFTHALEEIVSTLKEQQKNDKADVVNEMLNNTPINNINNVVKDLKKTTEKGFADIKSDNKTIIREIKTIKSQREAGMFDKIEDPKNKNKIVDGIKVVMLIAGGVLALGMAFKVIGNVDFMSVVALSTAMLLMSKSFSKIVDIKNLSYKNVFIAASVIPIMALALAASGFILSTFPVIRPMQGLSIIMVSGALGIASYLLLKAINKFDSKSLIMIPLIPVILPMIALGIVASSYILKNVQQITFMQVLSIGLIGLALGVATIGISFALKAMRKVTWKEMLMLPLTIPLIAGGIVAASLIFKYFEPLRDPIGLLIGSAVIGISMLFFVPAIVFLGKLKTDDLIKGVIAILPLALVMTASSYILNAFVPLKDPLGLTVSSLAMGVSLLLFTPAVWILGKLGIKTIALGVIGALAVSGGILGVSYIFSILPDNMRYPPLMWSLGAGLSIFGFGLAAAGLGFLLVASGGIGAIALAAGLVSMLAIAGSIVAISFILNEGDYTKYPPLQWALGVGLSIIAFSVAAIFAAGAGILSAVTSIFTGDKDPLLTLANSMVNISKIIQNGEYDGNYPSLKWAAGVGAALIGFAGVTLIAGFVSIAKVITRIFGDDDPLLTLTKSLVAVSFEIQKGNYGGNYPSLKWATGVGTALSLFAAVTLLSGFASIAKVITRIFGDDDPLLTLTKSLVSVSKEIQNGNYANNYPKSRWSLEVSEALILFAGITMLSGFASIAKTITKIFGDDDPLLTLTKSLVAVSKEIQKGVYAGNYPKKVWVDGVSIILESFMEITKTASKNKLKSLLGNLFGGNKDPLLTLADSMVNVSKKIQEGIYGNNFPSKEYSENVSYFIITISDMVDEYNISNKESINFKDTSSNIIPAINSWGKMLSSGDFKNAPSKRYSKDLVTFILSISKIVDKWDPTVKESKDFVDALKIILPTLKNIKDIPVIDKSFSRSMGYFENGLDDIGDSIYDFKKLKLSLKDLDDFSKSMKYIVTALKELEKTPNVNVSLVDNMKLISKSLDVLSEGVDDFMDGLGRRRKMSDFMDMSIGLNYIASALQSLITLRPIPSDVLNGFTIFLGDINKMTQLNEVGSTISKISALSNSFLMLANSLTEVNNNLNGFNDISKGLYLISIIDETNFDNVLKSVDKHKGTLQVIGNIPEEQVNLLSVIKTLTDDLIEANKKDKTDSNIKFDSDTELKDKQQKQFYEDVSEIRSLLYEFKDNIEKPSSSGSFNKYK